MMQRLSFIALFFFVSCNQQQEMAPHTRQNEPQEAIVASTKSDKVQTALTFINAYVDNCNQMKHAVAVMDWVNSSQMVTVSFKSELKRMMDAADAQDPEMGLDADPLFDAQDFPEQGFEPDSTHGEQDYVMLQGISWPEFKLTMNVVNENGTWLVDGCGMVNIPDQP